MRDLHTEATNIDPVEVQERQAGRIAGRRATVGCFEYLGEIQVPREVAAALCANVTCNTYPRLIRVQR